MYQGFVCSSVTFRTSPGLAHDTTTVELYVDDFNSLEFSEGYAPSSVRPPGAQFRQPLAIYSAGTLLMSTDAGGELVSRAISDLYVYKVKKPKAGVTRGSVRLTLVDGRHLWNRGYLDQWRFNLPVSNKVSLEDMVKGIVSCLPANKGVRRVPRAWSSSYPVYEFDYLGKPRAALREILGDRHARVAWNDDTTVSFWLDGERSKELEDLVETRKSYIEDMDGEGHIVGKGYNHPAPVVGVVGGERIATVGIDRWEPVVMIDGNPVALADALKAFAPKGTAEKTATGSVAKRLEQVQRDLEATKSAGEVQEAEEAVKFATKQFHSARSRLSREKSKEGEGPGPWPSIDEFRETDERHLALLKLARFELERVKQLHENRAVLEALEADLIEQAKDHKIASDAAWLRRFVMRPSAWQVRAEFSETELEILRRDAYKLFRLPGATTYNKRMLPMLKRAERDYNKGSRLPVKIMSFRYKKVPTKLRSEALSSLISSLNRLKHEIASDAPLAGSLREAIRDAKAGVFGPEQMEGALLPLGLGTAAAKKVYESIVSDEFAAQREGLALVVGAEDIFNARIAASKLEGEDAKIASEAASGDSSLFEARETNPDDIASYKALKALVNQLAKAEDPFHTGGLEDKLSRQLTAAGQAIRSGRGLGELQSAKDTINQIKKVRRAERKATRVGAKPSKANEPYVFINYVVQTEDTTARVVDPVLGLVRFSKPVGILTNPNVTTLDAAEGLLAGSGPGGSWPVKVYFGTKLTPITDNNRPVTGVPAGSGDEVPPQVEEVMRSGKQSLGYYSVAYPAKGDRFPRPLDEFNKSDIETIHARKLVELITVDGSSNVAELDLKALDLVTPLLDRATIESSARISYLRPLKIDCDGVLSGVEVFTRRGMIGFNTVLSIGRTNAPFGVANKNEARFDTLDTMTRPMKLAEDQ